MAFTDNSKFRFLWENHADARQSDFETLTKQIYGLIQGKASSRYACIAASRYGSMTVEERMAASLRTQLSRGLKPVMRQAVATFFGVPESVLALSVEAEFQRRATQSLRASGRLAAAPYLSDLFDLAPRGANLVLRLNVVNTAMLGLRQAVATLPTFQAGEFVRLQVNADLDGRLRLIHLSPQLTMTLVLPSVFMRNDLLPKGRSLLPRDSPPGHPQAFAIHEPVGMHTLVAVVVTDPSVSLPEPSPTHEPRPFGQSEFEALGHEVGRLGRADGFGVGILRYQVLVSPPVVSTNISI